MSSDKTNPTRSENITEGLHDAQILFMKRIEKENFERVMKLKRIKKNNILTGVGLAGAVFGIYSEVDIDSRAIIRMYPMCCDKKDLYSILAVKQENFMDELDDQSQIK